MEPDRESHDRRCDEAAYAYGGGEFDVAAALFAEMLCQGSTEAAVGLGEMYLRGEGVDADVEKGLELLRKAAAAGNPVAAFNLGALHRTGAYNVLIDAAESRRYFLLARELGCSMPVEDYLS